MRGCGTRKPGGVYAVTSLSPYGTPLEEYLLDPPRPVDMASLGITAIGVHLLDVATGGKTEPMLFDWIGSAHYPNVADFVEELRAKGLSRRLPSTLDWASISKDTRLVTIHERAWIDTHEELRAVVRSSGHQYVRCPKKVKADVTSFGDATLQMLEVSNADHETKPVMCAGLWWHDIEGGAPIIDGEGTAVARQIGDVIYDGYSHGRLVENMSYQPAAFAAWPVQRIEVVRDPVSGVHEERAKRASASGVPVEVCDE